MSAAFMHTARIKKIINSHNVDCMCMIYKGVNRQKTPHNFW